MEGTFVPTPNMRHIVIHKPQSEKGNFTYVNRQANMAAMRNLSYSAYELYMYINLNADGYGMYLSRVLLEANSGMPKNTYVRAFNELVKEGYLVRHEKHDSLYDFYEVPIEHSSIPKMGTSRPLNGECAPPKKVEKINNKKGNTEALSPAAQSGVPKVMEKPVCQLFYDF